MLNVWRRFIGPPIVFPGSPPFSLVMDWGFLSNIYRLCETCCSSVRNSKFRRVCRCIIPETYQYSVLSIYHRHFSSYNSRKAPHSLPVSTRYGWRSSVQIWPKFYHCNCAVCTIVSYITGINCDKSTVYNTMISRHMLKIYYSATVR